MNDDKNKKKDFKSKIISYTSKVSDFFNSNKFLNMNISMLINMNIIDVRKALLEEIDEYNEEDVDVQRHYFQRLFDKIFSFEPGVNDDRDRGLEKIRFFEQRLYADIILTPGFLDNEIIREFLINDYEYSLNTKLKYHALIKIMNLHETLSPAAFKKFSYCFRNSGKFADLLLIDNRIFDRVLNNRNLSMFSKETFCQIFSFLDTTLVIESYFFSIDDKALFLISQMGEHVYNQVGSIFEFIDAVIKLNNDSSNFSRMLVEFYDRYVGDEEHEEIFKDFIQRSFPLELNMIINNIYNYYYDFDFSNPFNTGKNLDSFMLLTIKKDMSERDYLFKKWKVLKANKNGSFSKLDLNRVKEIILKNIFGISLMQMEKLVSEYGYDLDNLEKGIALEDRGIFETLKAITRIDSLTVDDMEEVIYLLESYLRYINKNGLNSMHKHNSFIVLEGLFRRLYMNTYNMILFNDLSDDKVIDVDDGVLLYDAGVNFNMLVSSINDVSKFSPGNFDVVSKWDTTFIDNGQYLSTSFISNENLGVISLSGQLLGFTNIPVYSLNIMGTTDMFSLTNVLNFRFSSKLITKYIIGEKMDDETRYGYNDILINRFSESIKPSYLVFYKVSDNYNVSKRYANTLKVAKNFNLPIVVIDFPKVLKHEKDELKKMTKELLGNDKVNRDLMLKIITRYMNIISGNQIVYGSSLDGGLELLEEFDFPKGALASFIDAIIEKCKSVENELEWIEALEYAYKEEIRKHVAATSIASYNCSIGFDRDEFYLDKEYNLGDIIRDLHLTYDRKYINLEDNKSIIYADRKLSIEVDTIIKLANILDFNVTYDVEKIVDDESRIGYFVSRKSNGKGDISLEERLIISYFTDNYEDDLLMMLNNGLGKNIKFGKSKHFFPDKAMSSIMYANLDLNSGIDMEKIDKFIEKLDSLNGFEFFSIFSSYIYQNSFTGVLSMEALEKRIINKKKNMAREFRYLNKMLTK